MSAPLAIDYGDTPRVHAVDLPVAMLSLAVSRGGNRSRLMAGTGLFDADLANAERRISPHQFSRLLRNIVNASQGEDVPFLLGLRHAHIARQRHPLQCWLSNWPALSPSVSPLWSPVIWQADGSTWLTWQGSHEGGDFPPWQAEACAALTTELLRSRFGPDVVWHYHFRHHRPAHVEQYDAHLAGHASFGMPADLVRIDATPTIAPAPHLAPDAAPFLDRVRQLLPSDDLPTAATALGLSPATLKRRLRAHGTHFQQQLDQHRRLELIKRLTSATPLAAPSANLARDTRRITGVSFSQLRQVFGH